MFGWRLNEVSYCVLAVYGTCKRETNGVENFRGK